MNDTSTAKELRVENKRLRAALEHIRDRSSDLDELDDLPEGEVDPLIIILAAITIIAEDALK